LRRRRKLVLREDVDALAGTVLSHLSGRRRGARATWCAGAIFGQRVTKRGSGIYGTANSTTGAYQPSLVMWQRLLRSRSQLRTVGDEAEDHPASRCDHHRLTIGAWHWQSNRSEPLMAGAPHGRGQQLACSARRRAAARPNALFPLAAAHLIPCLHSKAAGCGPRVASVRIRSELNQLA
jgi:hypothetical protein